MKRIFGFLVLAVFVLCGFVLISCDKPDHGGEAFFRNAKSARNVSGTKFEIEFLVTGMMLKDDTRGGGVWLIGGNNASAPGWYDIAGIKRSKFHGQPQGRLHSCILLSIQAIRINDKLYVQDWVDGIPSLHPFDGNKKDITFSFGNGFHIIAGDITKFGPGQGIEHDAKQLQFSGVEGQDIKEFIIQIDETKLHNEGTLLEDWWNSFSFRVVH